MATGHDMKELLWAVRFGLLTETNIEDSLDV